MARIEDTLTWKDITDIPDVISAFSASAAEKLGRFPLKAGDESVYLVGRGSSDNATLFAKYLWEMYTGVRADFIRPHSVFEARYPLNFRNKTVWAYSQSGQSTDVVACMEKVTAWGADGIAGTNESDLSKNPLARAVGKHIIL